MERKYGYGVTLVVIGGIFLSTSPAAGKFCFTVGWHFL
jgi:hypothetical protein